MEEKEEKERKKKLENAKVMSASSIPSNVDLRGRALLYVCDLMLVAVN